MRTANARCVEWHNGWGFDPPIHAREFYRYEAAQPDETRNSVEDPASQADVRNHAALLRELKLLD
ncbi:MAG: hypothetical protein FJ276_17195 [Planctomycetes bacterium]|nr:hypothetical protein [Planctomycetota bacterium]